MGKKQRVTITSIAQTLSLSVATVSYVMNGKIRENGIPEKTAERVRNEAKKQGYVPNDLARSLRRQKTSSIGIILSDLQQGWAESLMKGVFSVVDDKDYVPYISVHFWDKDRERRELESMVKRRMEAIMTVPMPENYELYNALEKQGIPLVFLQDELEQCPDISFCMWDAREAAKATVRHMIQNGRKKIGFTGIDHYTPWLEMRLHGYREAMQEAGLEVREEWICLDSRKVIPTSSNIEIQFGKVLEELLIKTNKRDRPDAFLAMNDAVAMTTLSIIKDRMGLDVPNDIAVAGMGDLSFAPVVGLTTAKEPVEEVGVQAAKTALRLANRKSGGQIRSLVASSELAIRTSTAPKQRMKKAS